MVQTSVRMDAKIIQIGGIKQEQTFICAGIKKVIIGTDFLQNHNAQINFNDNYIQKKL